MISEKGFEDAKAEKVMAILEMQKCEGRGGYLGLLYLIGRSNKKIFQYLKNRVWKKVQAEKLLSYTRKKSPNQSSFCRQSQHMQCNASYYPKDFVMRWRFN